MAIMAPSGGPFKTLGLQGKSCRVRGVRALWGQQWTLSYLDHNVRIGDHNVCVGNSLIGVASPGQLVDATGGTTILAMLVMDAMAEAGRLHTSSRL
jgi:hypothetical protein